MSLPAALGKGACVREDWRDEAGGPDPGGAGRAVRRAKRRHPFGCRGQSPLVATARRILPPDWRDLAEWRSPSAARGAMLAAMTPEGRATGAWSCGCPWGWTQKI
ncbi:MAG: hypothetical protein Kow0013_06120 [Pararhodobacter sp.]